MRKGPSTLPTSEEAVTKRYRDTSTGLAFEGEKSLRDVILKTTGYDLKSREDKAGELVLHQGKVVGLLLLQRAFLLWLDELGIEYNDLLSRVLVPDTVIFNPYNRTVYVVEMKSQKVSGSADEKLQTCVFKRGQFLKLFHSLKFRVEYTYLLSDWFKHSGYKDVRDYIYENGCSYHFDSVPVWWFGFPDGE